MNVCMYTHTHTHTHKETHLYNEYTRQRTQEAEAGKPRDEGPKDDSTFQVLGVASREPTPTLAAPCYSDSSLLHIKVDALNSSVMHTENNVNKLLDLVAQQQDTQRLILSSQQKLQAQMALLLQFPALPMLAPQQRHRAAMVTAAAAAGFTVERTAHSQFPDGPCDRSRGFSTVESQTSLIARLTRSLEIEHLGEESNSAQDPSLSRKQTDASGQNMHDLELSASNGKRSVPETDKSKRYVPPDSPNSPGKPPRARQVQEVGAAATTAATKETTVASSINTKSASLGGKGVDRESEVPSLTSPVEAIPATHSSVPGVPGRDRRWDQRKVSPSPRGEGMAFRHLTPGEGLLYGGSGSDLALVSTPPRCKRSTDLTPQSTDDTEGSKVQQGLRSLEMVM